MPIKSLKRQFIKTAAATLTICIVVLSFCLSEVTALAGDIVIAGDAAGYLRITSSDGELFNLQGMYPGDSISSSITVRNEDFVNEGFELSMYVENIINTEYDLGQITKLQVISGENGIYDGMLTGVGNAFNSAAPLILGRIPSGNSVILNFHLEIDGGLATNEYQQQQSQFVVTFIADSYGPPGTPPSPSVPFDPDDTTESDTIEPGTAEPVFVALATVPEQYEEIPLLTMDESEVPLGIGEITPELISDPENYEYIEIGEEDVPFGSANDKEMPKTGETSILLNIFAGLAVMLIGYRLLQEKLNKRRDR